MKNNNKIKKNPITGIGPTLAYSTCVGLGLKTKAYTSPCNPVHKYCQELQVSADILSYRHDRIHPHITMNTARQEEAKLMWVGCTSLSAWDYKIRSVQNPNIVNKHIWSVVTCSFFSRIAVIGIA